MECKISYDRLPDAIMNERLSQALPTALQRFWSRITDARQFEQLCNRYFQGFGKAVQQINRGVLFVPFQAPDIRPVNFGVERESLLREATLHPESPQIPSYQRPPVHRARQPLGRLLNHGI
jgi:hypothetical protein